MLALRQMLRLAAAAHLAVTPDGPRGPRRHVQPGVAYLAARTGLPIVPVGMGYRSCWRMKSWDRFVVPKLGSRATCITGTPICVPAEVGRDGLEHYRLLLEQELNRLNDLAQAWAETGRWPDEQTALSA
jgi:lysophospholipid acyltransferase (LPLAT)-like uncharacterized protein